MVNIKVIAMFSKKENWVYTIMAIIVGRKLVKTLFSVTHFNESPRAPLSKLSELIHNSASIPGELQMIHLIANLQR